jgi:ribosomal protein S18 acetylase RimI-like enzyme
VSSGVEVTLRPVTASDDELLLSLYASTRAAELAQVPWSPEQKDAFVKMQYAAQKRHYAAEYPQASHQVICDGAIPVGRLYLARGDQAFHILDITVLPQQRKRGVGSTVLRRIMDEARQAGKPVTIHVENFNPSLELFRHLGFHTAAEQGFQSLLRWPDAG